MDPVTRRFRGALLRAVGRRMAIEFVALSVTGCGMGVGLGIFGDPGDIAIVLLGAQATTGAHVAAALVGNPLPRRFLRRYTAAPLPLVWSSGPVAPAPALEVLGFRAAGLLRAADHHAAADFALHEAPSSLVLAVVGNASGSVSFLSVLDDGRMLMTSTMVIPPSTALLTERRPGADPAALVAAHQRAAHRWLAIGHRLAPVSQDAVAVALERERAAYADLGLAGTFLDLTGKGRPLRFCVRPPKDRIASNPVVKPSERPRLVSITSREVRTA